MLKLAIGVLVSLCAMAQTNNDEPWTIGFTPDPPEQGKKLTVTGKPGAVVEFDWDPAGTPVAVELDKNGQANITVPVSATSVTMIAQDGMANDVSTPVVAP